jgi:hypothetical protein
MHHQDHATWARSWQYCEWSYDMTDSDAEMIASLKGFTPGPWERDGICVSQMSRPPTEICLMGNPPQYPGDIGGMMVNSMHNAALIAAAPDLHRIATEQAAEIKRLRDAMAKGAPL